VFGTKNPNPMKLNLEFMLGSGTFLIWLGVTLGIASIILFIASGGHVAASWSHTVASEDGSIHRSTSCGFAILGWLLRLVCLLPLFAGLILVFSGWFIHHSIREFKVEMRKISSNPT
jgi:hypothetical protein